eukprot:Protomagalhaensia_sp_Gyna_25__833@NODE_1400_length_1872_cov_8_470813_g1128_i0_p2_GENE_NODE_1400_length_1872_cov_8_470813_g1128_i0NODE_1400_length_1872_cov_8_470813_g1128_i0_p2_ORF_typecomplete_len129_score2_20_NODE_1400_length_1872_cov_8_470813_g1128_i08561242
MRAFGPRYVYISHTWSHAFTLQPTAVQETLELTGEPPDSALDYVFVVNVMTKGHLTGWRDNVRPTLMARWGTLRFNVRSMGAWAVISTWGLLTRFAINTRRHLDYIELRPYKEPPFSNDHTQDQTRTV